MVFRNIVEQCIIQMRQELQPRTILRKITDPLPFLALWAQIFSVWLESQRGNWTFYPKYYCKLVAEKSFPKDRSCDGRTWAGGGRLVSHAASRQNSHQNPVSEVVGRICKSHLTGTGDTIREINAWKQHLGRLQWECQRVLRVQEPFWHGC